MYRETTNKIVDQIINEVPGWIKASTIEVKPLEGLTNTNYSVTVDGESYVLRVSGQNTALLGINREHELEILHTASETGIGARIAWYQLPEGHLVTHRINGHHLTLEEYRTPQAIQRIVQAVKQLHELPIVNATFSPFRRVESYAWNAQSFQISLPHDFEKLLERMQMIEDEQAQDPYPWQRFCHNDLFSVNVLDDGKIHFIDWEFAGVNDIYYDLATLTYAYDSLDTLSRELQEYLLLCYFDEVREANWKRLIGMKYMLMFFTGMWGLLQEGMKKEGLVRTVEGFDYLEYANTTFEMMRQFVNSQQVP